MATCSFCDIINRKVPAEVIYETATTLAFFPLEPASRGHTLVVTKKHVETFLDVLNALVPSLWQTVTDVGRALNAVLRPEGMNVISSAGRAASQSIIHVHVHLVPRWIGDPIGEIWPPKVPTSDAALEGVADAIREHLRTESLEDRNPEQDDSHPNNRDV
jgi:histidine triad (HIT) family protein